ncbi:MAG: uroporphyrinogen-III synthase [Acidobacteriota bacterium]
MADLAGAKIVLLEARMNSELANLVRRHGGEPVSVPAVREVTKDNGAEVAALIDGLSSSAIGFIVFQTGVGVMTMLNEAEKLTRKEELIEALRQTTIIARGPKPTAVLSRNGLKPNVATKEPFTTSDLLEAMQPLELTNKTVAVLHYGERNAALAESLAARGAHLLELCLYEWFLPEDTTRLEQLIEEIIQQDFTAIAFTSQIQARHLFQLAEETGKAEALRKTLNERLVVASVGPTCTSVLQGLGIAVGVEPENPKMGPMVLALASYLDQYRER